MALMMDVETIAAGTGDNEDTRGAYFRFWSAHTGRDEVDREGAERKRALAR